MRQFLIIFTLSALIISCGEESQQLNTWPAQLISVSSFSGAHEALIYKIISEFNENSEKNLISIDPIETDYKISIKYVTEIVPLEGEEIQDELSFVGSPDLVAGKTYRNPNYCEILISNAALEEDGYLEAILLHEIGHCMGLEHVPEQFEIMSNHVYPISLYTVEKRENFYSMVKEITQQSK